MTKFTHFTIADEQKLMANATRNNKLALRMFSVWSVDDEIDFHANGFVKASVSRNKREGKYLINRKGI